MEGPHCWAAPEMSRRWRSDSKYIAAPSLGLPPVPYPTLSGPFSNTISLSASKQFFIPNLRANAYCGQPFSVCRATPGLDLLSVCSIMLTRPSDQMTEPRAADEHRAVAGPRIDQLITELDGITQPSLAISIECPPAGPAPRDASSTR
jgi:hypothetical protein